MSGGTGSNNSWTILTSEETVAETLRPFTAGMEQHEESCTAAAGSGENSQPANGAESAERLPMEDYLVSEEAADHSGDSSSDQHSSVPTGVPSSLEASSTVVHGGDDVSPAESLPESTAQLSPDPDSSSDSYTLLTQSPDEPPASLLSTETLGGAEFAQEETLHLQNGEELHVQGEESDQHRGTSDLEKQTAPDSSVDAEVFEEQTGEDGEPEERRKRSLLAALEQIGRREEEEEEEEDFQVPQRENDSGFSVNKCILGAVILLGLGTIFFSGVLMDLDEESDYSTRELKDTETPGQQEWLIPDAPPPQVDADSSELLNKLAEGNQHISMLQAQLQAQKEELKVAKGQAAEGVKERLHREEVEKENSRLKTEMASLLVLQKENNRMKKELESVPALQKELETLRSTVTELKLPSAPSEAAQAQVKASLSPPTGQPGESKQSTAAPSEKRAGKQRDDQKERKAPKQDRYEMGDKKQWKEKSTWQEGEKHEHQHGDKKDWRKGKHEQEMSEKKKDKEAKQKKHSDDTQQWKEKDWKKTGKGDAGKPWKDREGRREWAERSEKKQWKEENEWKKGKDDKMNGGKQWRGKEERKDWQAGKDHSERHKIREEWKEQKEWKKVKNGVKESGREKWERRDWKEKGEKKDLDWRGKNVRDQAKEGKGRGERKQQENGKHNLKEKSGRDERKRNEHESRNRDGKQDKEWKKKNDKWDQLKKKEEDWNKGQKERKQNGDWKKDKPHSLKNNEHKLTGSHHHKEEHLYGDGNPPHTHHKPTVGQPEYWSQQRHRLQHDPRPPQQCDSVETCAKAERLLPVPLPEFEAVLQTYLTKAGEAGVDEAKREELKKLATDFFKDGTFVHNQMSFQAFAEDVGDILEDMVEGENGEEEDSDLEDEMEDFKREVMKRFALPGAGEKEEKIKGERRKENVQRRG